MNLSLFYLYRTKTTTMKLEIKEPCHEDWNNMKIGMRSRHCDVCEKSVQDFTKRSRAEIITYLLSNPNDSTCGRMTRDQFDFRHEDIPILIETLKTQRPSNPFLILALVCLSLSSCAQEQPSGNIKTPPPINHPEITIGKMIAPIEDTLKTSSTGTIIPKPSCGTEMIEQGEIELLGDISVEEIPIAGGISIVHENSEQNSPELKVRQFAEKMPEFPGGIVAMQRFINENLVYPEYEKKNNIQGNVYVRFVVEIDGYLSKFEILRGVEGANNFNKEVLRVLNLMPKWIPGENSGKKLPVYMSLPFEFRIK